MLLPFLSFVVFINLTNNYLRITIDKKHFTCIFLANLRPTKSALYLATLLEAFNLNIRSN